MFMIVFAYRGFKLDNLRSTLIVVTHLWSDHRSSFVRHIVKELLKSCCSIFLKCVMFFGIDTILILNDQVLT